MKVTKITAYKDLQENLHETETEAIDNNIHDCLSHIEHHCSGSEGNLNDDIIDWIRNYPKEIRYILANIKHARKFCEENE